MWFRWSTVLKAPESENMSVNCLTRCEPCNRLATCPGCILNPDMKYKSLGGIQPPLSPLLSVVWHLITPFSLCVFVCVNVVLPHFYWCALSSSQVSVVERRWCGPGSTDLMTVEGSIPCVYNVTVLLIFVCAACPLPGLRGGLPPP